MSAPAVSAAGAEWGCLFYFILFFFFWGGGGGREGGLVLTPST